MPQTSVGAVGVPVGVVGVTGAVGRIGTRGPGVAPGVTGAVAALRGGTIAWSSPKTWSTYGRRAFGTRGACEEPR